MTDKRLYREGDIDTLINLGYQYFVTEDITDPNETFITILLTPFVDYDDGESFMKMKPSRTSVTEISSFEESELMDDVQRSMLTVYVQPPVQEDVLKH